MVNLNNQRINLKNKKNENPIKNTPQILHKITYIFSLINFLFFHKANETIEYQRKSARICPTKNKKTPFTPNFKEILKYMVLS